MRPSVVSIYLESGSLVVRQAVSDRPGQVEIRSTKTGLVRGLGLDTATSAVLAVQKDLAAQRCAVVGVTLKPGCLCLVASSGPFGTSAPRARDFQICLPKSRVMCLFP